MKSLNNVSMRYSLLRNCTFFLLLTGLMLFFASCTVRQEPYAILEFKAEENVYNYSKTGALIFNRPDSLNPAALLGSMGDLIISEGDILFIYNDSSSKNKFVFERDDRILKVNNRINNISIPNNDTMIPWFEKMNEMDFSALQFINISSKMPEGYFPYLTKLSEIKPDAGLFFEDDFSRMAGLLKIFKPRYIAGPKIYQSDFAMLPGLTNLEVLMISLGDSVINEPLPSMPALKQLLLTDLKKDMVLPINFLTNNEQIERIFIQKTGSLDCSVLDPLNNLIELVAPESDAIVNLDLINNHRKLELLSLSGDDLKYNPSLIKLPRLRWMAINSNVKQEDFDAFINAHPNLETIEIIANDTIKNLMALSKLSKLTGLIISGKVTDVVSVKTLVNLKYLSLPVDFLKDSIIKADLQRTLPGTRINPNEGLCLGSGWLLLLVPFVMIIRFLRSKEKRKLQDGIRS